MATVYNRLTSLLWLRREALPSLLSTYKFDFLCLVAALMVLAWVGFATVGIFIARYTREVWGEERILGQKVWFQVSRNSHVFLDVYEHGFVW